MSELNPYEAPRADLHHGDLAGGGTIAATLAGRGELALGAILGEAWDRLTGAKWILLGGFALFYVAMAVLWLVAGVALRGVGIDISASPLWSAIGQLLFSALVYPFAAGVVLTAARHMTGLPIAFADLFANYGTAGRLLGAGLLVQVLTLVGFVLFIIPGIYLSVAYLLTGALIAERDMGIWQAMETSRKLVSKHWFTVFGIGLVAVVLMMVSALFLLVPLIWTLPWAMLCIGAIYRNLVGVEPR